MIKFLFSLRGRCHEPTECYNCMCEARRKASRGKVLLLFLVTCMHDPMHAVCMVMRRLADKRYSNLWDGGDFKCMIEHSGRCVKELEILRPFQTWSCLYKAWSQPKRRREEPEEIRVREHQRVSEEEMCAVYEPVPSTVTMPSPSLNILKLSSTLPRSTVGLSETPRTSTTVLRYCTAVNNI